MPRRKPTEATAVLDSETTTEMSTEAPEATDPKLIVEKGEKLTGQALLDYAKENKGGHIDDVIFGAGYFTKKTDPETEETKVTLHKPQFWAAISAASNPDLEFAPAKRAYSARAGRKPVVTVVKNGNIVVGSRHSTVAGFEPGSQVHVQSEAGRIILTPYSGDEGGVEAGDDDLDL